jgi:hypothetical protein
MLATEFSKRLSPFALMINRNAMAASYKCLGLSSSIVRGCAAFGVMEVDVDLPLSDALIYVKADEFMQVMKSLPAADLELSVKENSLHWKCGSAKGQLALLGDKIEIPEMPEALYASTMEVGDEFAAALSMASLAAGSTALLSVGLYGVTLINDDYLEGFASDNRTFSTARLCAHVDDAPDIATLSPQTTELIASIISDGSLFGFDDKGVYCATATTRLAVNQVAPLKHDLRKMADKYQDETLVAPLNRDIIAQFIKRADAMADERGRATVSLSVEKGAAMLAFQGSKSSSEEFYLVEGQKDITVEPIKIEARRMARALAHATDLIFDYSRQGALVLRGANGFRFVISAQAE